MPAATARSMYSTAPMAAAVLSRDELLAQLEASEEGLISRDARWRLDRVGPNEPAAHRRGAVARELLGFLANPLVLILILASVVSAVLGDVVNAAIIALMVVLSVVLNFS
jgi:Mg2+-importing ATPase